MGESIENAISRSVRINELESEVARLTRERDALSAQLDVWHRASEHMATERDEAIRERNEAELARTVLAAEVRELRKDRERLDFVLENYSIEIPNGAPITLPRWLECREDIDAAMGEAK